MSDGASSLLEQAAASRAAAPVFSFFDDPRMLEDAVAGAAPDRREFTGERLFRERPDVYGAIVQAHANGLSQRQIARALRVSTNTVAAVVEREPGAVEAHKQRTISGLRRFVGATIERMLEDLDRMPLQSLPVALGVAVDKLQLLTGEATQRVERVEVREDKVRAFIDSLPVIEAEVLEIAPAETGVAGGTDGQKGSGVVTGLEGGLSCDADCQSGVLGDINSVSGAERASLTASFGELGGPSPRVDERGGGGAAVDLAAHGVIDSGAENFGQGVFSAENASTARGCAVVSDARVSAGNAGDGGGGVDAGEHPPTPEILCRTTAKKKKGPDGGAVSPRGLSQAGNSSKKKGGSGC